VKRELLRSLGDEAERIAKLPDKVSELVRDGVVTIEVA
jgi:hypothetical protein